MTNAIRLFSVVAFSAGILSAQAVPQFEVASVRRSVPMPVTGATKDGRSGGPGVGAGESCGIPRLSMDAGRVNFACIGVAGLIGYAYGVRPDQITGPDWLSGPQADRFDVVAKLPAGTAESQLPLMFQSLLMDRFKLAIHRGSKEVKGYALAADKGGLKLKEAAGPVPAPPTGEADPSLCPPRNFNCAPQMRNFGGVLLRVTPATGQVRKFSNSRIGVATVTANVGTGKTKIEIPSTTAEGLADVLTMQLGSPVTDATGAKGRYEVVFEISLNTLGSPDSSQPPTPEEAADRLFTAYQNAIQKLGLRLEQRKAALDTVVIDRVEKTPTDN